MAKRLKATQKKNRPQGMSKRIASIQARQRGYLNIIERLGYSGGSDLKTLPKKWGGFNKPGTP